MIVESGLVNYVGYDAAGNIVSHYRCPAVFYDLQAPNEKEEGLLVVDDTIEPADYYVDTVTLAMVQRLPILVSIDRTTVVANGVDLVTITDLPIPCDIQMVGGGTIERFTVPDGMLELSFDTPGRYHLRFLALPGYLAEEVEINAA